jgi:hypothetical protein
VYVFACGIIDSAERLSHAVAYLGFGKDPYPAWIAEKPPKSAFASSFPDPSRSQDSDAALHTTLCAFDTEVLYDGLDKVMEQVVARLKPVEIRALLEATDSFGSSVLHYFAALASGIPSVMSASITFVLTPPRKLKF